MWLELLEPFSRKSRFCVCVSPMKGLQFFWAGMFTRHWPIWVNYWILNVSNICEWSGHTYTGSIPKITSTYWGILKMRKYIKVLRVVLFSQSQYFLTPLMWESKNDKHYRNYSESGCHLACSNKKRCNVAFKLIHAMKYWTLVPMIS
jgi:hypothetical protein